MTHSLRTLTAPLLLLFALCCALLATSSRAEEEYLEPTQAFRFSARMADPDTIAVTYAIADGYYMYRERFRFVANGAVLGEPSYPAGKVKYDETFQKDVEMYRKSVTVTIPVLRAAGPFTLTATSQGCADAGLCYSPMDSVQTLNASTGGTTPQQGGLAAAAGLGLGGTPGSSFSLAPPSAGGAAIGLKAPAADRPVGLDMPAASGAAAPVPAAPAATSSGIVATPAPQAGAASPAAAPSADPEQGRIERTLNGGSLAAIVPLFLLLGLGLSFTPCVLPMVPILSAIIVGEGAQVRRARAFTLSAAYALGMALVYTLLGVAAGLAGEGLAAALQNAWVLGAFAMLMVLLSGAMFGLYELQLPAALQTRLSALSHRQRGGKLAGVFVMGALSALIVGPCVAAPLAGALVYISQTRDVAIGAAALFSMAVGMSVPLLLVGLSAGALLPRAGSWMVGVKRVFGVLMLGMALWLASPVLPPIVQMLGWMLLALGYGLWLLRRSSGLWPAKAFGLLFVVAGALQLVGVASGGRDPWAPLAHLGSPPAHTPFVSIKTTADLDRAIAQAGGRTVMLDFYADWCVSCKEMEKFTFSDGRVRERFAGMVLLQADVTANDADDRALLRRFKLFGPPGIVFFGADGREVPGSRVIGFQDAGKFLASLRRLP